MVSVQWLAVVKRFTSTCFALLLGKNFKHLIVMVYKCNVRFLSSNKNEI